MDWDSVGGILHRGGTIIGTARSEAVPNPAKVAAKLLANLIKEGN